MVQNHFGEDIYNDSIEDSINEITIKRLGLLFDRFKVAVTVVNLYFSGDNLHYDSANELFDTINTPVS